MNTEMVTMTYEDGEKIRISREIAEYQMALQLLGKWTPNQHKQIIRIEMEDAMSCERVGSVMHKLLQKN
jgi:hypothetical protein